jgi:hypothetical protein
MDWNDIYVNDGTRLGPSRVDTLRPIADTAEADRTASAGADHYAVEDETTINGDTDYVSAATPGDLDLYEMGKPRLHARYGARRAGHHGRAQG